MSKRKRLLGLRRLLIARIPYTHVGISTGGVGSTLGRTVFVTEVRPSFRASYRIRPRGSIVAVANDILSGVPRSLGLLLGSCSGPRMRSRLYPHALSSVLNGVLRVASRGSFYKRGRGAVRSGIEEVSVAKTHGTTH